MNSLSTAATPWTLYWRRLWTRLRWVTHPITVFVSLQIVWLAITLIWVIWFAGQQAELGQLARRFGREYFDSGTAVAILVVGCVLLGVLLVGTIALFVFGQRQSHVARQQRNFVSSVTHELKSPLASLQLGIETLQLRRLSDDDQARIMEMVNTDIDRLRRLIDQILVAGRLDRGLAFDDDRQIVPVIEVIDRIAARLSYLDPVLAKRLTVDCAKDLSLRASHTALSLILNNLLENAVKYSPRSAPIRVTVEATSSAGILIGVKDQGMGLDRKDVRRIFKMFQRSDHAIRKAIPGTGLGLYIVRSVVGALGGRVWVESPGRDLGSTFLVSLPGVVAKGGDG